MRVDRSWDKGAADGGEQHIHLAIVRNKSQFWNLKKYSPGGNIESVAAPSEKSMKGEADKQGKTGRKEVEEVEVDEENGVGGQAEHAG